MEISRQYDNKYMNTKNFKKEINEGNIEATELIAGAGLKEEQAKEFFNAWRIYLIDRMMEEYDKNNCAENDKDPMTELEYDIEYYKSIVAKEKGIEG